MAGNSGRRRDPSELVAPIVSVDSVVRHMAAFPGAAWPTETFHYPRKAIYLNGEAIEVLHQSAAHTDSDAFAFFRRSDVVMAGDVVDTRQFPVIDVERGGSIRGEIEALNHLIDLAVPSTPDVSREGGTIVVPGHGRLYDHFDVVEYREYPWVGHEPIASAAPDILGWTQARLLGAPPPTSCGDPALT